MELINNLIIHLIAIGNFCKDIHYNCKGEAFYSKHILVDRIQENLYDYIDRIKEVIFLAENKEPLSSSQYLQEASRLIPAIGTTDKESFQALGTMILNTLRIIEDLESLTKGEENLIGAIAEDLQGSLGLINQQVKE